MKPRVHAPLDADYDEIDAWIAAHRGEHVDEVWVTATAVGMTMLRDLWWTTSVHRERSASLSDDLDALRHTLLREL